VKKLSTLQIALGASIAVHAVLLTVRFVDPEGFNRVFQDTPLEVILVNSSSKEKPEVATAIAQASLAGGGEQEKGRATSPLPPAEQMKLGDSPEDTHRKIESLQEQQTQLLAQLKKALAALPPPDMTQPADSPAKAEQEEKRKQLSKLLAEIERRINEENARPKKRYISPATREEAYAVYYDELRRKIEQKGTTNFPQLAGKKLYGELTMTLTVDADGRVLDTDIVQTSGSLLLDRRAQTIARGAGPFGRFSKAMRAQADQIVVVSRFNFTRDDSLETKLTSR
jgi:protein TonB